MTERVYQPESKASEYFLGDWTLCVRTNALARGETRVELENRLVLLLVFFIEHQGEVLGKECILKTIWQGKVVNDDSLAVAISHLRKALGDNSRSPDYIKTIPGVGYQLIAKAGVAPSAELKPESVAKQAAESVLPAVTDPRAERNGARIFSVLLVIALLSIIFLVIYFRESAQAPVQDVGATAPTNSALSQLKTSSVGFRRSNNWQVGRPMNSSQQFKPCATFCNRHQLMLLPMRLLQKQKLNFCKSNLGKKNTVQKCWGC
jgi:DNA-binding winged helix-turn-helix (wHTH) protein